MCGVDMDTGTNTTNFPLEIQSEKHTLLVWYRKSGINALPSFLCCSALRSPPGSGIKEQAVAW